MSFEPDVLADAEMIRREVAWASERARHGCSMCLHGHPDDRPRKTDAVWCDIDECMMGEDDGRDCESWEHWYA